MQRHDPKESAEKSSKESPVDRSHAYKIAKWTNMSNEGSKLSRVPVNPPSGKSIISSGYKTVKWTDMCSEGSQISAAPMGDYKVVKWTHMSWPQCPQLPSRDYNDVVKWTNVSSEGSQLIKEPVDLGGYKVVKWTDMSISQELGGTHVDASMTSHDYKIVRWVDMTPKDGSQGEEPVYPSCDRNRTVESAAGLQPSVEEIVDPWSVKRRL